MFAPKNILVPTDFSIYADHALMQALDIAKQNKSKIYLLHVVDDEMRQCNDVYCLDPETMQNIYNDSVKYAGEKLQQAIKKIAGENPGIEILSDIRSGNPPEEILKEQEGKSIDLIVIASHGKTGLLKNLLGGVADKVAKRAKCPVLLLKS